MCLVKEREKEIFIQVNGFTMLSVSLQQKSPSLSKLISFVWNYWNDRFFPPTRWCFKEKFVVDRNTQVSERYFAILKYVLHNRWKLDLKSN